jgi:hypothetical protein
MSRIVCLDLGRRNTRVYLPHDGYSDPVPDRSHFLFPSLPQGFVPDFAPPGASPSCVVVDSSGIVAGNAAAMMAAYCSDVRPLWLHSVPDDHPSSESIDGVGQTIYPDFVLRALILRALGDYVTHTGYAAEEVCVALHTDASPQRRSAYARACKDVCRRAPTFVDSSLAWYASSDSFSQRISTAVIDIGFESARAAIIDHQGPRLRVLACANDPDLGASAIARDLSQLHKLAPPAWLEIPPVREDAAELALTVLNVTVRAELSRTTRGAPFLLTAPAYRDLAEDIARRMLALLDEAVRRGGERAPPPRRTLGAGTILSSLFGRWLAQAIRGRNSTWQRVHDPVLALGRGMARLIADPDWGATQLHIDNNAGACVTAPELLPATVNEFAS